MIQLQLEQLGFKVIPACDGLTAFTLARTQEPDIVVTDYKMDKINGMELCACIRKVWLIRDMPLILFSNLDMSDELLAEAREASVAVVPGSHDLSDLLKKIIELLS